jgi:hypothetical protein
MNSSELEISSLRASPVLFFLRSSESLRKVDLNVYGEDGGCVLQSIMENPYIEDLTVVGISIRPSTLRIVESTTYSFKRLAISVATAEESAAVAAVLTAHQTLEHLSLFFLSFGLDGELNVIESVIRHPTL